MRNRIHADLYRTHFTVTIDFQAQTLDAPPTADGTPMKWLPCQCCHSLEQVETLVTAITCAVCAGPCIHPDCGLAVYEHYGPDGEKRPCEPWVQADERRALEEASNGQIGTCDGFDIGGEG